jgi:dipeptidase
MIAGKETTQDGSILFVKTEDDGLWDVDYLWYVPRKPHKAGSVLRLMAGGTIPQVPETYAFFWDECPGTSYSNGIVNEWGVAFGSNGCTSREDPVDSVAARGDLVDGGLGFELRFILAERSRTAREAVLLAAQLIDRYGYNASGRNLNIVDPGEAWQLQMVRGKQYVARRVRDDEVVIVANTFSIRRVDMDDNENFICSPDLIDYAAERGWYDPSEGEAFDFAEAYAPRRIHRDPANTDRQWNMARLLNRDFPVTWQQARTGMMPVSVKPDRKLSLKDAMGIFRNHYEGSDLDLTESCKISPHETPVTPICRNTTHRTTVIQQRSGMPREIGTLIWRSLDRPCCSVFVPWYLGCTRIPEAFHKAPESFYNTEKSRLEYHFQMPGETWKPDLESASGVFKRLGRLVNADYRRSIGRIQEVWRELEESEITLQPYIEETALAIYQHSPALAREYLTVYSGTLARKSLETAKNLIKTFPFSFRIFWNWVCSPSPAR